MEKKLNAYIVNVFYGLDEYPTKQRIVYAESADKAEEIDAFNNPAEYETGSTYSAVVAGYVGQ